MKRSTHSPQQQSAAHAYEEEQNDDFDFEDVGLEDAMMRPPSPSSTPTSNLPPNNESTGAIDTLPEIKEVSDEKKVEEGRDGEVSQDYKGSSSTRSSSPSPSTPSSSRFAIIPPDNIEDEKHKAEKKNQNRLIILIVIILLILIATGVGLALGLKDRNVGVTDSQMPTTYPTRSPTLRPPSFSNTVRLPFPRSSIFEACDLLNILQGGTADRCRSLCAIAVECCKEDRRCRQDNRDRCDEYFGPCVALEMLGN